VAVSGLSGATDAIVGDGYSCALTSAGTVRCWGLATAGQNTLTQANVPGLSGGVLAVARGDGNPANSLNNHLCALLSDGTVKCWGDNTYGQLGDGTKTSSSTAVAVLGLNGATAVAAGGGHSCAALSGGTVKCWGLNSSGQLGNGTTTGQDGGAGGTWDTPVAVSGLSGATAVVAGGVHSCALLSDHTMMCWGANSTGQLGNGTTASSSTPVAVAW
jgi:alpha-tubulin suppressor-like RCC1 family protein